jgi:hypothetical protein
MMNVRERLAKFQAGVGILSQEMPDSIKALLGFFESATKDGALTFREKELVALESVCITDARIASLFIPTKRYKLVAQEKRFWKLPL